MTQAETDRPATGDETPDRSWALTASLALSTMGIAVNLVTWTWANGQRRTFDAMLVQNPPLPRPEGWEYLLGYLLAMLTLGALALTLGFVGVRSVRDRPWLAMLAGALATSVLMVPVVFLVGHALNHWPGSG